MFLCYFSRFVFLYKVSTSEILNLTDKKYLARNFILVNFNCVICVRGHLSSHIWLLLVLGCKTFVRSQITDERVATMRRNDNLKYSARYQI